jgi:flagellar biosynthetic protein FliR
MTLDLSAYLSGHVFQFMLVFTRLGAGLMMFPGIGESFVSPRIRLLFALSMTLILYPVLMSQLPEMPTDIPKLFALMAGEALIGVFFGAIMRLLINILETAGAVISIQTGLSNAMILNPTLAQQSALPSVFLGIAGVTALFSSGLDHLLLEALLRTYQLFPVGNFLPPGDIVQTYVRLITQSFAIGVQIAAPFLIIGLLLMVALGFMQRLMSQVQLFLIVVPVQILGGLLLIATTLAVTLQIWLRFFAESIAGLGG